jgi:hypothetical protein
VTPGVTPIPTTEPGPGPTATPAPGGTPEPGPEPVPEPPVFRMGNTYQISLPYMDAEPPLSGTQVNNAFDVPMVLPDGTVNFQLHEFNPKTQLYVPLNENAILFRGKGYFLRPQASDVRMKVPGDNPPRVATNASTFSITLHRDPSRDPKDPDNGYNLIGFPFDPEQYASIDWKAIAVSARGQTFDSLDAAVAAGILDPRLTTLEGTGYISTTQMKPFVGYFARTYVDGTVVTLRARTSAAATGSGSKRKR